MRESLEGACPFQGPHLRSPDAHLRLTMHPAGPSLELQKREVVVGRHSDADLRLPSPEISRRHCRLFYWEGVWRVQDLQSLNGVYINEEQVVEAALYDGDLLRLGDFVFRVCYAPVEDYSPEAEVIRSIAGVLPKAS